jgi:transcriptional regulator with PAS, ATPase and Fis domain
VVEGETYHFLSTKMPLYDVKGDPYAICGIAMDITERKQAEEAVRRERDNLLRILDSMEDGVDIINEQYEIEYANPCRRPLLWSHSRAALMEPPRGHPNGATLRREGARG